MNSEVVSCAGPGGQTLSSALSEATLDLAIDSRATVLLRWDGQAGGALAGSFAGGDERSLHLRIPESNDLHTELPGAVDLEVTAVVGGKRYAFLTCPLDPPPLASPDILLVVRPPTISQLDRRRSRRRNLRSATQAVLRITDGEDHWTCMALILNISPDGLACRVRTLDAPRVPVGTEVMTEFQVDCDDETFHLPGCVVNSTRAGTSDQVVLGIEFISEEACEQGRRRLLQVLAEGAEQAVWEPL